MAKLKDDLISALGSLVAALIPKSDKTKLGVYLYRIWVWQEISSRAETMLKNAWLLSQEEGLIPGDEDMRAKGESENIVAESGRFSCVAKVSKRREAFDPDLFIGEVAKKYKLKVSELKALAERCKKEGKAPLSKRVLEA